jgi:hypothetical protein
MRIKKEVDMIILDSFSPVVNHAPPVPGDVHLRPIGISADIRCNGTLFSFRSVRGYPDFFSFPLAGPTAINGKKAATPYAPFPTATFLTGAIGRNGHQYFLVWPVKLSRENTTAGNKKRQDEEYNPLGEHLFVV